MVIPKKLNDEIIDYCQINNIDDIDKFKIKLIRQGFTVIKYGSSPIQGNVIEKIVEVQVETIVEAPTQFIDMELDERVNGYIKLISELENKVLDSFNLSEELKKTLAEEKLKKRNLYGE